MAGARTPISLLILIIWLSLPLLAQEIVLKGRVVDPQGNDLPKASVRVVDRDRVLGQTTTGADGRFQIELFSAGQFVVKVDASGFRPVEQPVSATRGGTAEVTVKMTELSSRMETVTVTADVNAMFEVK